MKKDERLVLCDLSMKVYGSKYKWKKMMEKGEIAMQEEIMEDGTKRKYKGYSRYTVEEIKTIMEEIYKEEQEEKVKLEAEALKQKEKREQEIKVDSNG